MKDAKALVEGDRQDVYGHPYDNFGDIAHLVSLLDNRDIPPRLKHAMYMVLVKIARLLNSPTHEDSWVDISGYALTALKVLEKESEGKNANK